jgi:hypothetical protein
MNMLGAPKYTVNSDPYSKSVGRIASAPYTRKNGVNHVALLGVVLRLHTTAGSSWSHFRPDLFSWSKILGLSPCRIMPLARSTWPLVCGCATAAQSTRMWNLSQNSRNFMPVNWDSLSVMMDL